jgi:hypothetical protein
MPCRSSHAAGHRELERGGCRTGSPGAEPGELHQDSAVHRASRRGLLHHPLRDAELPAPLRGASRSDAGELHQVIPLRRSPRRALLHLAVRDPQLPATKLTVRRAKPRATDEHPGGMAGQNAKPPVCPPPQSVGTSIYYKPLIGSCLRETIHPLLLRNRKGGRELEGTTGHSLGLSVSWLVIPKHLAAVGHNRRPLLCRSTSSTPTADGSAPRQPAARHGSPHPRLSASPPTEQPESRVLVWIAGSGLRRQLLGRIAAEPIEPRQQGTAPDGADRSTQDEYPERQ